MCLGCQIFPDVACYRKILDLKVKCSYVGCPWTGELRAVQVIFFTPDEGTRQECRNVGSMNRNFFGYIH